MTARNRLWILVPCVVASGTDAVLTLLGQSGAYWSGDYGVVREWNPLGQFLLRQHPLFFVATALIWIALFSAAIMTAKERVAIAISFTVTLVHSICAAAWLWRYGWAGVVLAVLLLTAMETLWHFGWRRTRAARVSSL